MTKSIKLQYYPSNKQIIICKNIFGACRFVWNKFLDYNYTLCEQHKDDETNVYCDNYTFDKLLNKWKHDPTNLEFNWLANISTKAIQHVEKNAHTAFMRFFQHVGNRPKFHSLKKTKIESFFFVKDNIHYCEEYPNIIKIPILGKVRVSSKHRLPEKRFITSGRVIHNCSTNKYYIMFNYDVLETRDIRSKCNPIGIDLGIKNYATIAVKDKKDKSIQHISIPHFINEDRYKKEKNYIEKLQQVISKKAQVNEYRLIQKYLDKHPGMDVSDIPERAMNNMKRESYNSSNIRKLQRKIAKSHERSKNIRVDYIHKLVYDLTAKTKPKYITIENLSIQSMLRNQYISHKLNTYIQDSSWYFFKTHLTNKCHEYGIELREANKFFASSKICSNCGNKKKDLTLEDRVYVCDKCGTSIDRDLNAAINLLFLKKSKYNIL